ncbi:MAG TPA: ThuA domain-containing protein, partial [Ilumatobacteraceae bacterium]|nr:ThuA domain-containing protein [Ilumatobacteraceae bacterium]
VVLVCGGRWHDFDHARLELLTALATTPHARTRVFENYDCIDALTAADLLITYTCDVRPDPAQQEALVNFVARGGRWLALHASNSAIDAPSPGAERIYTTPRAFGPVAAVLGSQFLAHPPIAPYQVQVTQPDHPLVAGVEPFTVTDELYISELHPPLDVILHADYTGACRGFAEGQTTDHDPRPVLYTRPHGDGMACYFTLGHCRGRYDMQDQGIDDLGKVDRGSWDVAEYRTVLGRCLAWGLGGAW